MMKSQVFDKHGNQVELLPGQQIPQDGFIRVPMTVMDASSVADAAPPSMVGHRPGSMPLPASYGDKQQLRLDARLAKLSSAWQGLASAPASKPGNVNDANPAAARARAEERMRDAWRGEK